MDAFLSMLSSVAIFVALAIPGYLLIKTKTLKVEQSIALSKLLMWVGMPFLILSSTLRLRFTSTLVKGMGISFGLTIAYVAVWFFITAFLTKKEGEVKKQGMMRFCMMFSNNGFLGLPLAAAVLGEGSDAYLYLVISNVLTNLLMYTVGVYFISGDKSKMSLKKVILNPVLISFVIGLIFNFTKVYEHVPQILTYSDYLKGIVTPVSMVILGMKMASVKLTTLFTKGKIYFVSALKLIAVPVGAVAIAYFLGEWTGVGVAIAFAMLIAFGTPTAGLASTFADAYQGDEEGAAVYTLGSTLLSVATLPVLYGVLSLIVG
jgi:predicted permease